MLRRRQWASLEAVHSAAMADGGYMNLIKLQLPLIVPYIQIALVSIWLILYIYAQVDENSIGVHSKTRLIEYTDKLDLSSFEGCSDSISPPTQILTNDDMKTFWFSQYPDSISEGVLRKIVQDLTGLKTGAKSYYAQTKKFRRCQGGGPTVACMQIHPLVGVQVGDLVQKFNPEVFYFLRDPTKNFPLHQNMKAIRYSKHAGQVSEDGWRQFRDAYVKKMTNSWRNQILTWKNMSYYQIGLYLPIEQLMDPVLGPELVGEMAAIFRSRGYQTVDDADIPCVWYTSLGKDALEHYHRYQYEYNSYTPGFTKDQIKFLAKELQLVMDDVKDDARLVEILNEYRENILHKTRLDHPWVNHTAA